MTYRIDQIDEMTKKTLTSTLILTLALTLLLTWVLSLRVVRLKIGDYYFNRGNFDQAVNWYQTQQR